MANLYTGGINTSGVYISLSDLTGITFTEGKSYVIQLQDPAYIREGAPVENNNKGGFFIFDKKPFQYTAGAENLYIMTPGTFVTINIAD